MLPYLPGILSLHLSNLDEFKWGIRAPSRYAISEISLNYLDPVQNEVVKFLKDNIKHDFLKPDHELTLNLTVREAEILMLANPDVRALAEKGELKSLHEKCNQIQDKVDADFLKTRDLLDRIVKQAEEKENEVYEELEKAGISGFKRQGLETSLFDILSFTTGNPSLENLTILEAYLEKNPDQTQFLIHHKKLHSYLGIKYRAIDA